MKKDSVFFKVLLFVCKYLIPVLVGYLEGDSHTLQDGFSQLF